MADASYVVQTIVKGIDRVTAPMKAIQKATKATGASIKANMKASAASVAASFNSMATKAEARLLNLKRKTDIFGKSFKTMFAGGIALVGLASIGAGITGVISLGMEFEQTITNAAAKFPGAIKPGTAAFKELEDVARQLGASTEFTSSQAASGFNYLAMAGFNAQQSIAALPAVVDLATAAQVDLARATDIATDTLGAMGLATKDPIQLTKNLARVNDVLAKTVVTSNTDMEQLFETITTGGPIAISAGSSIEQYAAMAGILANNGIKASVAGTTLKNVFTRLAAVTPGAAKVLERLGVKTKDANGNLRDVSDILGDISAGIKREGLGTAQATAALEEIFGKIPLAGVTKLLDAGSDSIKEYTKQLENASGASKEMAAIMRSTTKASWLSLQSAMEGLGITIFKQVQGPLTSMINTMTELVRGTNAFVEKNPMLIKILLTIGKLAAPIIGVTIAIGLFNLAISAMTAVLAMNPFTFWLVAITALVTAFIVFRKEIMGIGKIIIAGLMMPLWGLFKLLSLLPGIGGYFAGAANSIEGTISGLVEGGISDFNGTGKKVELTTPEIAQAQQAAEITKNNNTTNKLVIDDRTGKARMEKSETPNITMLDNNAGMDSSFMGA